MPRRPKLQDFIDDELLRAPMAFDAVIDAVQRCWRLRLPVHDRMDGDPVRALQLHRGELVAEAMSTLRLSAQGDAATQPRRSGAPAQARPALQAELSLIGEDDVAVDIEIARCTQLIRQQAEVELRELHTFTSALVDDLNVARDTNPFRPERLVRALWAGLQRVPLSRPVLAAFLHEAAGPLAQSLRQGYASACRRLHDQGIEPAAHRTIVYSGGTGWGADLNRYRPATDLHSLHDSMPAALDALLPGPATAAQVPTPDAQLIELLARLFSAIQDDRALGVDTVALLQRLQPTVLRLALHDSTPLDTYEHPVWRFMDHLTYDIACCPPPQRPRLLGLCRNLVDHLAALEAPDGSHFSWAIVRLAAARRHGLAQAITAAAPQIERLQRIANAEASPSTLTMALDIGTLDTVPAALLAEPDRRAPAPAPGSLVQLSTPGSMLQAYLQGEWRQLQCLWRGDDHELLLLTEPATGRLWALRRPALSLLLAEALARPLRVRSLVRRAADKVLHAL